MKMMRTRRTKRNSPILSKKHNPVDVLEVKKNARRHLTSSNHSHRSLPTTSILACTRATAAPISRDPRAPSRNRTQRAFHLQVAHKATRECRRWLVVANRKRTTSRSTTLKRLKRLTMRSSSQNMSTMMKTRVRMEMQQTPKQRLLARKTMLIIVNNRNSSNRAVSL